MVPLPPCVVPGTMVAKPFGTTCEEVIGAERREKFFQVRATKFSKVVPLLGGSGGMRSRKNFENDAVRLAKNPSKFLSKNVQKDLKIV